MSNLSNDIKNPVENQENNLSSLFNSKGEIIGMPHSMFENDSKYSLKVRKELEQYGELVYGVSSETKERFKKLVEYWRPQDYRRRYCGEEAEYFYDQAEDMGLVGDEIVSKYVAGHILKFMTEHNINNSFMQKMFNEIWRDTGSFNVITDDQQEKASDWVDLMFSGPQAVKNRRKTRQRDVVMSNEVADGLMGVAKKLFGHNGSFDITDINALYIFETALSHARNYPCRNSGKDKLSRDEVISKLILTFCKDIVVYWSKPENIKLIPVDKRSNLFNLFRYVENPENDFTIEQLESKQLFIFSENQLSTYINPYAYIQQNIGQATIDTLDGDYIHYDYRGGDEYENRSKIPAPYRYYSMETRLELAKFMPDDEACRYYMELIKWRESCSRDIYKAEYTDNGYYDSENVKMFRLIADRTSDPKIKLEYIKKWLQFDKQAQQIYASINDDFLLFADDIKRKIISPNMIPTFDKEHQHIAMLILERTNDLDGMIAVQGENPYQTAHSDLSKRALKGIIECYKKMPWGDFDELLSAIDIVLESKNHAISAQRMREVLATFYSHIKKKYNKEAKSSYYANRPEALETSYYGEQKNMLESYLTRLTEQMKIEGQMQKIVSKANHEIVKPQILKLTKVIRQVALNKAQQEK